MTDVPEILFVCVHNAGRSQMAAAFARTLGGDRVRVRSAGSAPGERVHPAVVGTMREVGVDLAAELPKLLTPDAVRAADVVVSMGCGDACPVFPGKRYADWALDDPKDRPDDAVRVIRDEIRRRVVALLRELGVAVPVTVEVYDPPMCCATGVCGPSVDPVLLRFAGTLAWLRRQGVTVVRHNLAQEPAAFDANPLVSAALAARGESALPMTIVDGVVVAHGVLPSKEELAAATGVPIRTLPTTGGGGTCA